MKLLTKDIRQRLIRNGETGAGTDTEPVVKLFTPDADATWLLTEIDPRDPARAFGLCDLGLGFPELGYVNLADIEGLRGKMGLPVERDRHFAPDKTLAKYAEEARVAGCIQA